MLANKRFLQGYDCGLVNISSNLLSSHVNLFVLDSGSVSLLLNSANEILAASHTKPAETVPIETTQTVEYDYDGALTFVLFIIFWYSLSVIALICTSTKKNETQYFEESNNSHANNLLRHSNGENIKQQALGNFTLVISLSCQF